MSSDKDVSGIGAARAFSPRDCSGLMTLAQLEPSAQAPCTRTMLAGGLTAGMAAARLRDAGSSAEEIAHALCDLRRMRFQRKMPGVEEANDGVGHVALESLGARRKEEGIVLAPHGEEGRPVGAEVIL